MIIHMMTVDTNYQSCINSYMYEQNIQVMCSFKTNYIEIMKSHSQEFLVFNDLKTSDYNITAINLILYP